MQRTIVWRSVGVDTVYVTRTITTSDLEYFESLWSSMPQITPEAEVKAEKLLAEWVTEDQYREWQEYKRITVRADNGYRYMVGGRKGYNIAVYSRAGIRSSILCIDWQTYHAMPSADYALALVLLIRFDLQKFLRTAQPVNSPGSGFNPPLAIRPDPSSAPKVRIEMSATPNSTPRTPLDSFRLACETLAETPGTAAEQMRRTWSRRE